ncbi:hypothetical protein MKW98_015975 [Papaver atlanticum]|uniref:Uncharacterized protein n=1 Tax=Papaver atlanticum TaxID=357466 RepID=A0AAD4X3A3_9MAGN|nr:hypothetical protein MKW98_015975 [Papaver atlanticum]
MGIASSRVEEDKALQLCQQRKKFVRQALDGRCSLAAAHVTYIQSLKNTGVALRKFIEPDTKAAPSLYSSTVATSEPPALTEKSLSQFSLSSPTVSQNVDAAETFSPYLSPHQNGQFQANYMKSGRSSSMLIEEKPPFSVTGNVRSATPQSVTPQYLTPQYLTPRSGNEHDTSPFEAPELSPEAPPWDFFGLPVDRRLSFENGQNYGLDNVDHVGQFREGKQDEEVSELEEETQRISFTRKLASQESEDEFDDLPVDNLVRSFKNLNREDTSSTSMLHTVPSPREIKTLTEGKTDSPDLSPLKSTSSVVTHTTHEKRTAEEGSGYANKLAPKDFVLIMREIESLFLRASECGTEVPRMLEANKFHFRAVFPKQEAGSRASMLIKGCFTCGDDPSHASEGPAPTEIKYLTWPKTSSSCSSSSRNLLNSTPTGDVGGMDNDVFSSSFMNSGSHVSTLDRLYAWERKLYDEVKACGIIRREYDMKCKLLRQQDSTGENRQKADKTRTIVKDLHSRIRVAIHRIDSISKRIEELRDKELQPQLEELIEGLSRMWEMMFEYHKAQYNIISTAHHNASTKISMHTESHRQAAAHLENELSSLSSSFVKWTATQKTYVEYIDGWLNKCTTLQQKSTRWKRQRQERPLREQGPPIFVTCGVWLDKLKVLPTKEVADSIKSLVSDTISLLPQHEKRSKKRGGINEALGEASEDWDSDFEGFQSSLVGFIEKLNCFAESSLKMYVDLKKAIEEAKKFYDKVTPVS